MKTRTTSPHRSPARLPEDYASLCRKVWLPRPIHDAQEHAAALAAIEPLWGREEEMNEDQADWFKLAADLIAEYEERAAPKRKPLPLARRLAGLLEAHGMTAADLGRLLELEPSMGSKIMNGARQLTAAHVRKLARHFALPADYFLEP
ncbi:MAG TPA: helix-turn-helix domain-containing protein [Prosthecobacter sp.]|nr:helix-turn-helix domain-containing protein [Prosthecobacter sp.]HRK16991.1 helix-turn-helix domain-containing protein [Prosthecobacter sp.]